MAVQMDAASEYFSCTKSGLYSALTGLTEFSICMWARIDDLTKDHDLCTWGPHAAATNGWLFWRDEDDTGGFGRADTLSMLIDNDLRAVADTNTMNDGNWAHYCVTVQLGVASGYHLYKNGVEVLYGQDSLAGYSSLTGYASTPVRWGEESTPPDNWLDGAIDDPRIYNRVLTPAEVLSIYSRRGTDDVIDGLLVRYLLQDKAPGQNMDGTADEVKDETGNAFHAYGDSGTAYATYRESEVLGGLRRRSA